MNDNVVLGASFIKIITRVREMISSSREIEILRQSRDECHCRVRCQSRDEVGVVSTTK